MGYAKEHGSYQPTYIPTTKLRAYHRDGILNRLSGHNLPQSTKVMEGIGTEGQNIMIFDFGDAGKATRRGMWDSGHVRW